MANPQTPIEHEISNSFFTWHDIVAPNLEVVLNIAKKFNIDERIATNCLDSEHLPNFEEDHNNIYFFMRVLDPHRKARSASIRRMTTKIAFFIIGNHLITIHRVDHLVIKTMRTDFIKKEYKMCDLIEEIFQQSIQDYSTSVADLQNKAESFEDSIFNLTISNQIIKDGHAIRRRAITFRKIFKFTDHVIDRLNLSTKIEFEEKFIAQREVLHRQTFYTEDLLENLNNLINLHLALASHQMNEASMRTNEIMRVLTIFSIFFLPITFIAGVYGMNFEFLPELKIHNGYFYCLAFMFVICIVIFFWARSKGWIRMRDFRPGIQTELNQK